jgi:hypothetical protein
MAFNATLGLIHVDRSKVCAHVFQTEIDGSERGGVDLDTDGLLGGAADKNLADAFNLAEALRDDGVAIVVNLIRHERVRRHRQNHNGRIGRVDLPIRGRRRQVNRQVAGGRINRRLHVPRGAFYAAVQIELDADRRPAKCADRSHLRHAGDLAQTPFQRRGHRRGNGCRVGSR